MNSLIWKWTRRVVVTIVAAFIVLYLGDMAVYNLRGSPQGHVHVNQTIVVPLKGNKQEYDYLGASDVPCSVSIFSQATPRSRSTPSWSSQLNWRGRGQAPRPSRKHLNLTQVAAFARLKVAA